MTFKSRFQVQAAVAAAIGALSIGSAFAGGDVLRSGDVNQMGHWYGNAGGLQGSDRVEFLGKPATGNQQVGISYDKDVAQRTNMQRESATSKDIGIGYDKDVAERTNLPRSEKAPVQTTGVSNK
jgi:hypothetical protein